MFWFFALAATAGLILTTPVLFQTVAGAHPQHPMRGAEPADRASAEPASTARTTSPSSFAGFALVTGGLGGLLALAFNPTDVIALVVALCLGFAGAAMHPELLGALRKP